MGIERNLRDRQVGFDSLLHRPAPLSSGHARSLQVPGPQSAKEVLVWAGEHFVLAVLPSTTRVDLEQLSQLSQALDGTPLRLATEDEVASVFRDCERGALPPFGRLCGVRKVVDVSLADSPEFVCLVNQRHEGLRLRFDDYLALEAPLRARFAVTPRRAG